MKKIIKTKNAPSPVGPYNQAILFNNTLYASGQIAINPLNNQIINEDIEAETKQVMENLNEVLKEAKMDFSNVVKCTIFLKDMNDFESVNQIYSTFFNEKDAPARETVEVSMLPKNVNVEISLIAIV
ncbi:MAG: Rid family detoxifying hydrolase [Bacteroidota bacterium]|jgi:2-iminobutanoate/2-iminopropanoate deaminase|nr:Rid family detoxifying hydrolase [Bacteroidota bacterium]MEC8601669.1 Rid family detoxifying hydrolase [Bacteroidota bacterium]MED5364378.1 Rid family detoxifying hydrolase [Bacteroidota bacterium]